MTLAMSVTEPVGTPALHESSSHVNVNPAVGGHYLF